MCASAGLLAAPFATATTSDYPRAAGPRLAPRRCGGARAADAAAARSTRRLQMLVEEGVHGAVEVQLRRPTGDAMRLARVDLQVEGLARGLQGLDQAQRVLEQHVVIGRAMHQQQRPVQQRRTRRQVGTGIGLGLAAIRHAEVALGVDGVVQRPVGDRGDGDRGRKRGVRIQHRAGGQEAAVAPAEEADACRVDARHAARQLAHRGEQVCHLVPAEGMVVGARELTVAVLHAARVQRQHAIAALLPVGDPGHVTAPGPADRRRAGAAVGHHDHRLLLAVAALLRREEKSIQRRAAVSRRQRQRERRVGVGLKILRGRVAGQRDRSVLAEAAQLQPRRRAPGRACHQQPGAAAVCLGVPPLAAAGTGQQPGRASGQGLGVELLGLADIAGGGEHHLLRIGTDRMRHRLGLLGQRRPRAAAAVDQQQLAPARGLAGPEQATRRLDQVVMHLDPGGVGLDGDVMGRGARGVLGQRQPGLVARERLQPGCAVGEPAGTGDVLGAGRQRQLALGTGAGVDHEGRQPGVGLAGGRIALFGQRGAVGKDLGTGLDGHTGLIHPQGQQRAAVLGPPIAALTRQFLGGGEFGQPPADGGAAVAGQRRWLGPVGQRQREEVAILHIGQGLAVGAAARLQLGRARRQGELLGLRAPGRQPHPIEVAGQREEQRAVVAAAPLVAGDAALADAPALQRHLLGLAEPLLGAAQQIGRGHELARLTAVAGLGPELQHLAVGLRGPQKADPLAAGRDLGLARQPAGERWIRMDAFKAEIGGGACAAQQRQRQHGQGRAQQVSVHAGMLAGRPGSLRRARPPQALAGPCASAKPSSSQPVMPPAMIFTGRPSFASRSAPRAAPLQCGPAQ
mmetsp:Transcript_7057/g.30035  ORF Transcript_7057/g.30035 Transcript_7057/m.30035 type:complete len:853 (-) Transcript_7057:974-3532(-)